MANEHLFTYHLERQQGVCALQLSEVCEGRNGDLAQLNRISIHVDRIISGKDGGQYTVGNTQLICSECDWKKEGNAPNSPYPELRAAYRVYKNWQVEYHRFKKKIMWASGDVKSSSKSPYYDAHTIAEWVELRDYFEQRMKEAKKHLFALVKEIPACQLIVGAWGGGPKLAAHIVSQFDIRKGNTVSSMWKYFGFDPSEDYNPGKGKDLKSPIYSALSISLIRKDSPYRFEYDEMRANELGHGQSLYRLFKLWLSHLWVKWRELEGLEVTVPYVLNHQSDVHTHYRKPEDFGW